MKIIVVTGGPWSRHQEVFELLSHGGLAAAKPAERGSSVSVEAWHQRALATREEAAINAVTQPGRALDQVAADLFVANWDQPLWGWADHRSALLLDYWASFDNAVRFVLLCTPPEIAIGRTIMDVSQPAVAAERTASIWQAYHTEMLRFYHRFRDRCLLLNEAEVAASPENFIESFTKGFDVQLTYSSISLSGQPDAALGITLATQYLDCVPEIGELWREIEASRTVLPNAQGQGASSTSTTQQIIVEISQLIRTSAADLATMTEARDQAEQARTETAQGKKQAEDKVVELEQQLAGVTGECQQQQRRAEDALAEGEQLLSQLHQTQEELETYYLQNQDLESSLQKTKQELGAVQTERSELEKRAKHYYQETERLTGELRKQEELTRKSQSELATTLKERDEERLKAATLRKEADELRNTLKQKSDALAKSEADLASRLRENEELRRILKLRDEALANAESALTARLRENEELRGTLKLKDEALANAESALATQLRENEELRGTLKLRDDALAASESALAACFRETEELRTQLSQHELSLQQTLNALRKAEQTVEMAVRQRDTERNQAEKLQNDRELILAQLNQVQDELERQFGQNKKLKQTTADYDRRWDKLMRRYPDYLDFESIEILDTPSTESAAAIQWRIRGLFSGKRLIPHLNFATLLVGENVALLLQRDPEQGTDGPLLSWPLEAADQPLIVLQPQGPDEDLAKRWSILHGLSTTDWQLVNALCTALTDFLRATQQSLPATLKPDLWIEKLGALREQFRSMPSGWRYDKVVLRRQALNPDYEHLWLRLENAQFGNRHWPTFEFRVAASLIQPEGFSQYPKLEFPAVEDGPKQFENWFAETTDELGPRYELRFALAEQAMDLEVFNRLSPIDQHQLISIVVNLPALLTKLEKSGVTLARPWEHWQRLVMGMIDVLRIKLMQSRSAPPPDTEARSPESPPPTKRIVVAGKSRKQSTRRR